MNPAFTQYLLERELLSKEQLSRVAQYQKQNRVSFDVGLLRLEYMNLEDLNVHLAEFFGVPTVRSGQLSRIQHKVIGLLPPHLAVKLRTIPIEAAANTLIVAMEDPSDVFAMEEIRKATGYMTEPLVAPGMLIEWALEKYYPGEGNGKSNGQSEEAASYEAMLPRQQTAGAPGAAGQEPSAFQVESFEETGAEFVSAPPDPATPEPGSPPAPEAEGFASFAEYEEHTEHVEFVSSPRRADAGKPVPETETASGFHEYDPDAMAPIESGAGAQSDDAAGDSVYGFETRVMQDASSLADSAQGAADLPAVSGDQEFAPIEEASSVDLFSGGAGKAQQQAHAHVGPPKLDSAGELKASLPEELREIDPDVLMKIPRATANKLVAIAVSRKGSRLAVLMADPNDLHVLEDLQFVTGHAIEPVQGDAAVIRNAIQVNYQAVSDDVKEQIETYVEGLGDEGADLELVNKTEQELRNESKQKAESEEAPVVKLVNTMIVQAIAAGASDIHIEPYEGQLRVRHRIDGILYEVMHPPVRLKDAIISRVKIMSRMNITEQRLPQDGSMRLKLKQDTGKRKEIDFRVSSLPTLFGEKMVMRILDKENLLLDMTKLGFGASALHVFESAIMKPYGMVLVVGPSGCGKTNTLYCALQKINTTGVNIMTAEDPVEFNMMGINQVQMQDAIGLNFAATLRSFLRQDPNIILVGEVRDFETAEIAVKASLTGHLVLSTLHTADAATTISRLMNMGIEPFLVASSLLCITAQRLVRKICTACKTTDKISATRLQQLGFSAEEASDMTVYKGAGCERCGRTGYKGRTALFEVLEITQAIRDRILTGATSLKIRQKAVEEGMMTLRDAGLEKLRQGVTSFDEVLKETIV